MRGPVCRKHMGPCSKDQLPVKTAFALTVGWSLRPGFTVHILYVCACCVGSCVYSISKSGALEPHRPGRPFRPVFFFFFFF